MNNKVSAEFQEMISVSITGVVQELVNVRDAVLRVVAFMSQRRETGHGNETQAKVAWVR